MQADRRCSSARNDDRRQTFRRRQLLKFQIRHWIYCTAANMIEVWSQQDKRKQLQQQVTDVERMERCRARRHPLGNIAVSNYCMLLVFLSLLTRGVQYLSWESSLSRFAKIMTARLQQVGNFISCLFYVTALNLSPSLKVSLVRWNLVRVDHL